MGALAHFSERSPTIPIDSQGKSPLRHFELTGTVKLDYANQKVVFDEPRMKQLQEWCKTLYHAPRLEKATPESPYVAEMCEGKSLLYSNDKIDAAVSVAASINVNQPPVVAPYRNAEERLQAYIVYGAAIRDQGENRQNAYDFLKLAMEPIPQTPSGISGIIPVRNFNLSAFVENEQRIAEYSETNGNLHQRITYSKKVRRNILATHLFVFNR